MLRVSDLIRPDGITKSTHRPTTYMFNKNYNSVINMVQIRNLFRWPEMIHRFTQTRHTLVIWSYLELQISDLCYSGGIIKKTRRLTTFMFKKNYNSFYNIVQIGHYSWWPETVHSFKHPRHALVICSYLSYGYRIWVIQVSIQREHIALRLSCSTF